MDKSNMRVEMLVGALQPLSILQVGGSKPLFPVANQGVALATRGLLRDALDTLSREHFDAIVLGSALQDAWSPTAYERVAEIAASTPIVAWTASVDQLVVLKTQQGRIQDVIVAAAVSQSIVEQLTLSAIIRSRALAAVSGLQTG